MVKILEGRTFWPCCECQVRYVKERHMRCLICQEGRGPKSGEIYTWGDWLNLFISITICLAVMILVVFCFQFRAELFVK